MTRTITRSILAAALLFAGLAIGAETPPSFTLAVSEYPSWSGTFLAACDIGLIDGAAGKLGPLEKKWHVDIVVKDTDYDSCITLFVNGNVDAACLTNIDSLAPSVTRKAVAILPTSTSAGADACLVQPGINAVKDLKGVTVRGLAASVSEYAFDKGLEALGEDPKAYTFENLDPVQVGVVLQTGKIEAGITWNPVVMETLKANPKIKRLFDSSLIKGHIIDMVTASRESLRKDGGRAFACAVVDTYYTICKLMDNEDTRDKTLGSMGKRFANLGLKDMRVIVKETQFYSTPEKGLALFKGQDLPKVMKDHVVPWTIEKGLVEKDKLPRVAFGSDPDAALCFDPQYMEAVAGK
ncbi:MAG: ABC transporter substrate-binding protein [Kiritimatiellae bacterium]|nr:ABC transporter substrate-binding protein [Kiritimatiellia bacterium]